MSFHIRLLDVILTALVATYTNTVLPTTRQGYFLSLPWKECIPIPAPPICVRFSKELSAEEAEKLKSYGASVISQKGSKTEMYSFGSEAVVPELISFLMRHSKKVEDYNPTPNGAINLGSFSQFLRVLGILTMFLKTQSYPAFSQIPIGEEDFGRFMEVEGLLKRTVEYQGGRPVKRIRLDGNHAQEEEGDDDDEMEDIVENYSIGSGDSSVPKAKPSTPPSVLYGGHSDLPSLPGLSFQYFQGMLASDQNYVADVIREYFLLSLGDGASNIIAAHKRVKGALGSISFSETGQILQHLFCGVQLAIQGQARLFPFLREGRYHGFALLGAGFRVSIDGYERVPQTNQELLKTVALMDEHRVALAEIMLKLAKMKLVETKRVPTKAWLKETTEKAAKNPRELVEAMRLMTVDDDTRGDIEKTANRLSYPQRFLELSSANILYAVDLLISGQFPPIDKPMFTRGGTITALEPAVSIFAMFGDTAFSFRTTGGLAKRIPVSWDDDTMFKPYVAKGGKETTPCPTIVLSRKSLSLCVLDWKDLLLSKQALFKTSRDSAFRSVTFGGQVGKAFWKGFVDRVGPLMKVDESSGINADNIELGTDVLDTDRDQLSLMDLL